MLNALGPTVVEARDVTVAIGGRPVLRGNDLTVHEGEFVALMGANGSGKSTLVRALTGLRPLTSGSVSLFGTPLADFHEQQRIGFVPQRATATGGVPASVREVVASGRLTRRKPLRPMGRADRAAIADALDVVGLSDRAGDGDLDAQRRAAAARPDRAGAGRRARAVLPRRADRRRRPAQPARARRRAAARSRQRGATVVLVAHELGPLAPLVDRAVVLRDGRVAYDGPPLSEEAVHAHHHHDRRQPRPRPHVGSPLDSLEGGR